MEHRERNRGPSDCFRGAGGKKSPTRDTLEETYPGLGATRNSVLLRFPSHHLPLSSAPATWPISFCPCAFSVTTGPLHSLSYQDYYFSTLFTLFLLIWDFYHFLRNTFPETHPFHQTKGPTVCLLLPSPLSHLFPRCELCGLGPWLVCFISYFRFRR